MENKELYCVGHLKHKVDWCKSCIPDKHNSQCKYYEPVMIHYFKVEKSELEGILNKVKGGKIQDGRKNL